MHDKAFRWFENNVDNGATILNIFLGSAISEPTKFVAGTAESILSIIKDVGAVKHCKNDFQMLGKDAAFLAAAVYRLNALKPDQRDQLDEQLQVMLMVLQTIKDFIKSCVHRAGLRQAISRQVDRKIIEQHRRKVADILARFELSILTRSTAAGVNNDRIHLTEGQRYLVGDIDPSRQTFSEPTTSGIDNSFPINSNNSPYFGHHDLQQNGMYHPVYAHQCPFHLPHPGIIHNTIGIPMSLAPSTIIYDYSYHTTHHGSHNYQGQNVNQGSSSHGLTRMLPQNIYMKHFNGNEIHCWTPTPNINYMVDPDMPNLDHSTNSFEYDDDVHQSETDAPGASSR